MVCFLARRPRAESDGNARMSRHGRRRLTGGAEWRARVAPLSGYVDKKRSNQAVTS